jgi:hypothetical protein
LVAIDLFHAKQCHHVETPERGFCVRQIRVIIAKLLLSYCTS